MSDKVSPSQIPITRYVVFLNNYLQLHACTKLAYVCVYVQLCMKNKVSVAHKHTDTHIHIHKLHTQTQYLKILDTLSQVNVF